MQRKNVLTNSQTEFKHSIETILIQTREVDNYRAVFNQHDSSNYFCVQSYAKFAYDERRKVIFFFFFPRHCKRAFPVRVTNQEENNNQYLSVINPYYNHGLF